jgi:hypothetical protein
MRRRVTPSTVHGVVLQIFESTLEVSVQILVAPFNFGLF